MALTGGTDRPGHVERYGQLGAEELTEPERTRRLADVIAEALARSGLRAQLVPAATESGSAVAVELGGARYLIELLWPPNPAGLEHVDAVSSARRPEVRSVLVSMSGFTPDAVPRVHASDNTGLALLDRSHLEAIISGSSLPSELITKASDHAAYLSRPYSQLTELLVSEIPASVPASFTTSDRSPAPWPLHATTTDEASVQVLHLLTDTLRTSEPLGMALADDDRLLVTLPQGIINVDLGGRRTEWLLPLPGCRGAPLILADGSVVLLRGGAALRWDEGVLTAIAGGLEDARALLAGPDDDPWVLSGHRVAADTVTGPLALSRLSGAVGRQHRYHIDFDANVRSAGWVGGLRFFLAAGGHSGLLDLAHSSSVRRDDWIESPHPSPDHLAVVGPQTVVTASPDGSGVRATVYSTDTSTRTSTLLVTLTVNRLHGIALRANGDLLLLGDVRGNNVLVPHPVLLALRSAHLIPAKPTVVSATRHSAPAHRHDDVRLAAEGNRKHYALDPRPIDDGGQGTVVGARHKPTGIRVAFKKLISTGDDAVARMRREIEAGQRFGDHRNIMPVLDFSPTYNWFVMPLAEQSAQTAIAELGDPSVVHGLVTSICSGLREPHSQGWIHRDIKPGNILLLEGRWVVADWGLGRRPRGQTSHPGRTKTGSLLGTEGFAAPEQSDDAHAVGPQADIYSIGQMIGWALTGRAPKANIPLLPEPGPWRPVTEAATDHDPSRRPATVDDLLDLIAHEVTGGA